MQENSFTTSNRSFVAIMREKGLEPSSANSIEESWTYDPTPAFQLTLAKVLSSRSFELATGQVRHDP